MLLSSAGDVIRYPEFAHDFINFSVSRVFEMSNVFAALRLIFFLLLWQRYHRRHWCSTIQVWKHLSIQQWTALENIQQVVIGAVRSELLKVFATCQRSSWWEKTCSQKVPISKLYNVKVSRGRKTICFSNIKHSTMLCKQCKFFFFFFL